MTNPLMSDWDTPYGLPPFAALRDADFAPAFDAGMAAHLAEVAAIANQSDAPTFDNTIVALEGAGGQLDRALSTFFTLVGGDTTPARQALHREYAAQFSEHWSKITSNVDLFRRIDSLWQARADLNLTDEEARVLMLTRRGFVRAGAALTGNGATRMAEIKGRLATLGAEFMQNLLADEAGWAMDLSEEDLAGLPGFVVDTARSAGAERGAPGPVVTLSRSLIVPFLQFSPRRDLRQKAWQAWVARGANGGDSDNRAIAAEVLALRADRAALLGYDSFAAFKLETEMAGTPDRVRDLLMQVWAPAKAQAKADAEVLRARMQADGINGPLEPWDWRYYAEARRKAEHDLDEAELKPYLQLDRMIEAAFDCATRLFGLTFTPVQVPLYHADCRAWEVTRDGAHVAVFIGDYFARASKRSGAWCSALQMQAKRPAPRAPIVLNVCNFAKPPKGQTALLSYDDARTLFHEFGHALHQMLSDVTFESVAGTSVARDFVELPSQLYEHWLNVPEVLAKFATHAETGAAMPQDLLEKVLAAATYDMGFQTVEYVASAMIDLFYHTGDIPTDIMRRQADILD
ncbi:MAG: M3 family metallopeptidase, partial [Paracoccaceae bacterium]